MNHVLLNIGLHVAGKNPLSVVEALAALRAERISVFAYDTHLSDSEPTLVAIVTLPAAPDSRHGAAEGDLTAVHRVAEALRQEAIAVFDPKASEGVLVGPNAAAWGAFKPEFFITLGGRRLSGTKGAAK